MDVNSSHGELYVHTDLENERQDLDTNRFCIPIYITNSFGISLEGAGNLVPSRNEPPRIRSGTLTLIRHEQDVYGVTCRHVAEALEKEDALAHEEWVKRYGAMPPPPFGHRGFRFPTIDEQIHINARFHKAPKDAFTGQGKDLAIARIPPDTFSKIKREAIPFARIGLPSDVRAPTLCGVATGFPEHNRILRPSSGLLSQFSMPTVTAVAPFDTIDDSFLRLFSELDALPEADNLSGMSGGPIFWSDVSGWGLTGIIMEGKDIHPIPPAEGVIPIFDKPTLLLEGEPLSRSAFEELISLIPTDDPPVPYCSPRLIMTDGGNRSS